MLTIPGYGHSVMTCDEVIESRGEELRCGHVTWSRDAATVARDAVLLHCHKGTSRASSLRM